MSIGGGQKPLYRHSPRICSCSNNDWQAYDTETQTNPWYWMYTIPWIALFNEIIKRHSPVSNPFYIVNKIRARVQCGNNFSTYIVRVWISLHARVRISRGNPAGNPDQRELRSCAENRPINSIFLSCAFPIFFHRFLVPSLSHSRLFLSLSFSILSLALPTIVFPFATEDY